MKKSVILTIAVIYIFAIVIVGFIGIRQGAYNENKYVDDIEILSDGYVKYPTDSEEYTVNGIEGYIETTFTKGLKIEIKCQVKPDNATNKNLIYICEESQDYKLIRNSDGTATIEFYHGAEFVLQIKSQDTIGFTKKIKIFVEDLSDILGDIF